MYSKTYHSASIENIKFLVTGGAGFIGSNLVEYLLKFGAQKVRVLDNLSTGNYDNLKEFENNTSFEFIKGDIRDLNTCKTVVDGIDIVFHEAALGSVPRSIADPIPSNEVNISGFLNMLVAVKESKVKRMVYAASSSTYGDCKELPKTEDRIGKPLSPYAITKYVNELYADIFSKIYNLELIGLRYFNVFGPKQSPSGAYAAVIPKFAIQLINHESPIINGDGTYSRDFTFVENVVQANILAAFTENPLALNTIYNVACGEETNLKDLVIYLKLYLSKSDPFIAQVESEMGPLRQGDIPHSLASIEKANKLLKYNPGFSFSKGLEIASDWYYQKYKK